MADINWLSIVNLTLMCVNITLAVFNVWWATTPYASMPVMNYGLGAVGFATAMVNWALHKAAT